MPSKKKTVTFIGFAALATLGAGTAFAGQQDDAQELQRLEASRMSLSRAIQAAEDASKGKAVSASLDMEQSATTFVVEVMNASGSQSYAVDAETGKLTALQPRDESEDGENGPEEGE